jgi:hypothetical protein
VPGRARSGYDDGVALGETHGTAKLREGVRGQSFTRAARRRALFVQSDDETQPLRVFDRTTGELLAEGAFSWSKGPAISVSSKHVFVNERAASGMHAALRAYEHPFD